MPSVNCDPDLGDMTRLCDIIKIKHGSEELWPDTVFQYINNVTLTLEIWPWLSVITHPWVMENKCVRYYPYPTRQWGVITRTWILGMWALWHWPWKYDLGSRSWHTLGSWTTIVWNIIQIKLSSEALWSGHRFSVYVLCDFDLGYKVMTYHWVTDNKCVKYYPDPTWQWGVMARAQTLARRRCEDGQTDGHGDSYTPTFVCGGV